MLTFEQFKQARAKGLSPQQIASFEAGTVPEKSNQPRPDMAQLQKEAFEARRRAVEASMPFGFAQNALKAGLGSVTQNIAKFAVTASEVPETLMTGRAKQKTYNLPQFLGGPTKGYISEAETRAQDIVAGEKPLYTALTPFVSVPAAGLETAAAVKLGVGLTKSIYQGSKLKKALNQTMPILTGKEKTTAGARKLTGSKLLGVKSVPNQYDQVVAKEAQPFVRSNIVKTENNIKNEIARSATKDALPLLKEKGKSISYQVRESLIKKLNNIEPLDITKADPIRKATYEIMMDRFKSAIGSSKNDSELYDTIVSLKDIMERQTGGKLYDEAGRINPTYEVFKDAVREVYDTLKGRVKGFDKIMKHQSLLFDALDGVAQRTGKLVGKSGTLGAGIKKAAKYGGYTAAGIGAGALGTRLLYK